LPGKCRLSQDAPKGLPQRHVRYFTRGRKRSKSNFHRLRASVKSKQPQPISSIQVVNRCCERISCIKKSFSPICLFVVRILVRHYQKCDDVKKEPEKKPE